MNKSRCTYLLLTVFVLFTYVATAQDIMLTGAIVIQKAEVQSYRIFYKLNRDNTITGYSISDFQGVNETKATIKGYYNPKNKSLTFDETSVISTSMDIPNSEFCLMNVKGTLEKKGKNSVFTGQFSAIAKSAEVECEPGTIMLFSEKTIEQLEAKATKLTEKQKIPNMPAKEEKKENWELRTHELTSGMTTDIVLRTGEVTLEIVDDRFQDGDKISLYQNEARIVSDFEITNKVKTFRFDLTKARTAVLTIRADSEGTVALTTVKASLRNGNEVNQFSISLEKGQTARIRLLWPNK